MDAVKHQAWRYSRNSLKKERFYDFLEKGK
jgi:hypothetical protein